MSGREDAIFAYHLVHSSLSRFGKPMTDLDAEARACAKADARRAMVLEQCVLASAEAQEVLVPPASLDKAVAQVRERYEREQDFEADLEANDLTLPGLAQAISRQLKVEAVLEIAAARRARPVTDREVRTYYHRHAHQFVAAETRTARQILITINADFADNTSQAARERIEAIAAELAADGGAFAALAARHSECPSALDGGLIGRVRAGTLYKELDEALFRLGEGDVTPIIQTDMGFHLITCDTVHQARQLGFDEVRGKIHEALLHKRRTSAQTAWLRELMGQPGAGGMAPTTIERGSP